MFILWDVWQTEASTLKQMLGLLSKCVLLLYNSVIHCCPNCCHHLAPAHWCTVHHPYSRGEAPFDCYHLGSLSDALNGPSVFQWPRSEGISSCEVWQSAENIFFLRAYRGLFTIGLSVLKCVVGRGLYGEMILLHIFYFCWVNFKTYIVNSFWLTNSITVYCENCAKFVKCTVFK